MMGWLILALLILLSGEALRLGGVSGAMLKLAGAALLIGACGYALQGRPNLGGAAARAGTPARSVPLTNARHAFFGQFSTNERWLMMSEAIASRGNSSDAAELLRSAIHAHPNDPMLWIGLGNALVDHAGVMTPPADLAFARAQELSPGYPAPRFFRGLALARSGDALQGVALWREILAEAPADASWRPLVEDGIATLTPAAERQQRAQGY
ncbi:MAG TPA: cytochrome C biosynthesis protein [Sphingomicrobium sp.]